MGFADQNPTVFCTTRNGIEAIPYGIVYKLSETGILVVAVMHLQRKPNYWINRSLYSISQANKYRELFFFK
ncbi:MAG: hypothetical protein F6K40_10295 [Okeania sp. SIO3I5]|uniref:hypothetical protein n=1 Tax=Okeania sp. SIO3I5 TaxID=2607805 RepID=UPI0013B82656|nr:hypothetical protein [Okeania sp. SIO3I5]NEQ36645.1 hypothetical protein [Okeania sp. SIO3I5]